MSAMLCDAYGLMTMPAAHQFALLAGMNRMHGNQSSRTPKERVYGVRHAVHAVLTQLCPHKSHRVWHTQSQSSSVWPSCLCLPAKLSH